jgi:four helix bundle protein
MIQSFRDLLVWQRSMDLATTVYRLTGQFPHQEMYGLVSQMRRIAEGHGRLSIGEYRQFLGIARASNFELQTQLDIARRLGFGDESEIEQAEGLSNEIGKMIYSILQKTTSARSPSSTARNPEN